MNALTNLFPRARAELFRLLFDDTSRELHLREAARLAELTPAALQREASSLAKNELLSVRKDGNRVYYRANTAHPIFPELHGIVTKTAGLAPKLRAVLEPLGGVELALIFGSTATEGARSGSDVDLLILGSAGLRKLSPTLRQAAEALGREINPISLTPAEWRNRIRRGDALAARILAEPKIWLKGGPDALEAMGD